MSQQKNTTPERITVIRPQGTSSAAKRAELVRLLATIVRQQQSQEQAS